MDPEHHRSGKGLVETHATSQQAFILCSPGSRALLAFFRSKRVRSLVNGDHPHRRVSIATPAESRHQPRRDSRKGRALGSCTPGLASVRQPPPNAGSAERSPKALLHWLVGLRGVRPST